MRSVACVLCGVTSVASAQPAETQQACEARRADEERTALAHDDPAERSRLLAALPDCTPITPPFSVPAVVPPAPPAPNRHLFTLGLGIGRVTLPHDSTTTAYTGVALSVGGGVFVHPAFALGVRVAGVSLPSQDGLFVGYAGPALELWPARQGYIGVGVGFGVLASSSDAVTHLGFEGRLGYAFAEDGRGWHVGVELTHQDILFAGEYADPGDSKLTTLLAELGYRVY